MALTPLDIHHKEFKTARFGGYNEEEVDSFLDLVADELERLIQENNDLKQQQEHLKKRLSEFEEMQTSLQSALLAATKSAEAVKEQARQESEVMVAKAQEEADSLVHSAQEQARQMTMRAQNERQKLERSFTKLRDIKRRYLQSIKELADEHLAQVKELEAKEDTEGAADEQQFRGEKPAGSAGYTAPPLVEEKETAADIPAEEKSKPKETVFQPEAPAPPSEHREDKADVEKEEGTSTETPSVPPVVPTPSDEKKEDSSKAVTEEQPEPLLDAPTGVKEESEEKEPPPSANLVDEVLAMDSGKDIYSDFEEEDSGSSKESGRKGRKDKREKHFFWE